MKHIDLLHWDGETKTMHGLRVFYGEGDHIVLQAWVAENNTVENVEKGTAGYRDRRLTIAVEDIDGLILLLQEVRRRLRET